ncbi:helix-turn-helix domain-containing protein [Aquisphaera insulae]|uniref:helix-turn-helix domain-containing protein n=1 Tax=Aquisphaera insulae TaxID=2712864 RepID=UPI0013EC6582|nr:helix-turn-helix domain-containing protein [Aquisphaera insulae]
MGVKAGGKARSRVVRSKASGRAAASEPGSPPSANSPRARRRFLASYLPLVENFPLEPIRDEAHRIRALAVVEDLLRHDLDEGQDAYLSVLTDLVAAHEEKAFPIPDASEADVLRELMRQHGLTQTALEAQVGIAQPTISAILRGARKLTREQAATLAQFFHVSPQVFLEVSKRTVVFGDR